ncbi:Hypothetical predicted protein [Cloeon dipterum]|uniref:Uncharacterized protein n=1 Tax=Cloeon dipterum TaxID=197152 RepID=A0A8S1BXA7_9INSE|nr:Hypothetical predicted protein [Cloeon dipterum]
MASLTVFMIYFCVLREENDLDDEMRVSLFDRLPGLEKNQLELAMEYNKERGIDTKRLESRLKEIESNS